MGKMGKMGKKRKTGKKGISQRLISLWLKKGIFVLLVKD